MTRLKKSSLCYFEGMFKVRLNTGLKFQLILAQCCDQG